MRIRKSLGTPQAPRTGARLRARIWAGRVFCAAFGVIAGWVIAEGALRLGRVEPASAPAGDPQLGFDQPTSFASRREFPEYGGSYAIRSNNLGFNEDDDTSLEKEPGSRRVVVVGDSQTVGVCPNSESWPHGMEQCLVRSGGARYEVINAAAGRYSPYQYYAKARHRLVALKPDLLIVGIYVGNDWVDLLRQDDRPYLTIDPSGGPVAHRPRFILYSDPANPSGVPASSRAYALLCSKLGWDVRYKITRARILAQMALWNHLSVRRMLGYMLEIRRLNSLCPGYLTQSLLQTVWFQHFPETLPVARSVFRLTMTSMGELCRSQGVALVCVVIPTKQQVEPAELLPLYARILRESPAWDPAAARRLEDTITEDMLAEIRALDIDCIDLRGEMILRRAGRKLYYPEDQHLSPEGNRLIGELVSERLEDWSMPQAEGAARPSPRARS